MKRLFASVLLSVLLGTGMISAASAGTHSNNIEGDHWVLKLVPKAGHTPFSIYQAPGGTFWFASVVGAEYEICIGVPGYRGRFAAVGSVDGRNFMDGTAATGNLSDGGYRVSGYSECDQNIPGYSRGSDHAAQFTFSEIPEGYDVQMGGDGTNSGVVAVRMFWEKKQEFDYGYGAKGLGAPTRSGGTRGGHATEYGREVDFETHQVDFIANRNRAPVTMMVRYAPEEALQAAGFKLVFSAQQPDAAGADPFPGAFKGAPAPQGWRP